MIRTLALAALLLAGCSPTEASSPAASPTAPPDKYAEAACTRLTLSMERKEPFPPDDIGVASRAVEATDPGIREAGQRLGAAAKQAGDLWVKNDPTIDKGPAYLRLADAQQGLLAACTNLFGDPPWPFTRTPAPTPSS
ncbi:hypothetical protein ACFYPH_19985 [Micromonospora sp. NPDC005252]|uniref:hypothetical protein n=1 Tax=unclassified Micromonospora TaxID=2617518 RepID=UPI003677BFC7